MELRNFPAKFILVCSLFVIVDGLFPQIQMFIFSGGIILSNSIFKFLLLLCLLVLVISNRVSNLSGLIYVQVILALIFLVYLSFLIPYLSLIDAESSIGTVLFGYNAYYFFYLLIPLIPFMKGRVSIRDANKIICFIAIIVCSLALAQMLFNAPILYTRSVDGSFYVNSFEFFDDTFRSFSFFSSSLNFGCFLIFLLPYFFFKTIESVRGKMSFLNIVLNMVFLILVIVSIYSTITRNVYLTSVYVIFLSFAFLFIKKERIIFTLPFGLIGFILFMLNPIFELISNFGAHKEFDLTSLFERFTNWDDALNQWMPNFSLARLLFGAGIVQNAKLNPGFYVDNMYLAICIHIGIVGFVLFMVMWVFMWWTLVKASVLYKENILIRSSAIAFSSSFIMFFINNSPLHVFYFLLFMITKESGDSD